MIDIGCGDGNLMKAINHYKGSKCFGVDIKKLEDTDTVKFYSVDIINESFPFADNTFDFAIMNHVLEHLDNTGYVLSEIRRILKPGGLLYIETPNFRTTRLPSLRFKKEQGMPINFYDDATHVRPYDEGSLRQTVGSYLAPVRTGKSRNLFNMIKSPYKILMGFVLCVRRDIFYYSWQLIGGASYIVCCKKEQ